MAAILLALVAVSVCGQESPVDASQGEVLPTTVDAAYRLSLSLSPLRHDVEAEHRLWLEDQALPQDERPSDGAYLERLQRRIAHDRRARALRVRPEALQAGCLEIELKGCSAPAGGFLVLTDDRVLHWQTQDGYTEEDGVGGGVVVLERIGTAPTLTPLVWTAEGSHYDSPILVQRGEAQLLILQGVSRGTGAGDMLRMLNFRDGGWHEVDTDWQARAGALMQGREVRHRPFWSFHDGIRALSPLWRAGDAGCCGEGGVALLEFEVAGDRLTLTDMNILGGGPDR